MEDIKSYILMGVEINPMPIESLHLFIKDRLAKGIKTIISSQNLHSVYLYHRDAKLRELQSIAFKRVDGMPLILWGKLLGFSLRREERVTWVDWLHPFMAFACLEKIRLFYLGSTEEVVQKAKRILEESYPGLQLQVHNGFFDAQIGSSDNLALVSRINEYAPGILIVGMGMPRQEYWVLDHHTQLNVPVILTCGAAMEYLSGEVSEPPRWMGRVSLEWLYRFSENPARFWRRYLVEPWSILGLMIRDLTVYVLMKKE